MRAKRAAISDPAAKKIRTIAQTVHHLDFHPLNFQQLSVMESPFVAAKYSI
jgi:hypothetical protein